MSTYTRFSNLLIQHLNQQDRTQAWLATKLETSRSTVTRWLAEGTRPHSADKVLEIANVLNLTKHERQELLESAGYSQYSSVSFKTNTFLHELRRVLSLIYGDIYSARRVVLDSGIDATKISFQGSPVEVWQGILIEAVKQKAIKRLIDVVSNDYPDNLEIRRITNEYHHIPNLILEDDVQDISSAKRKKIVLTIEGDISTFTEQDQETLERIIKEILNLKEPAEIIKTKQG